MMSKGVRLVFFFAPLCEHFPVSDQQETTYLKKT